MDRRQSSLSLEARVQELIDRGLNPCARTGLPHDRTGTGTGIGDDADAADGVTGMDCMTGADGRYANGRRDDRRHAGGSGDAGGLTPADVAAELEADSEAKAEAAALHAVDQLLRRRAAENAPDPRDTQDILNAVMAVVETTPQKPAPRSNAWIYRVGLPVAAAATLTAGAAAAASWRDGAVANAQEPRLSIRLPELPADDTAGGFGLNSTATARTAPADSMRRATTPTTDDVTGLFRFDLFDGGFSIDYPPTSPWNPPAADGSIRPVRPDLSFSPSCPSAPSSAFAPRPADRAPARPPARTIPSVSAAPRPIPALAAD